MSDNKVVEVVMYQDDSCEWQPHSTLVDGKCRYSDETKESYISKGFTVMPMGEACNLIDTQNRRRYITDDYVELTEDQYMDAIEQLPPHRWYSEKKINFYECLESTTGDIRAVWIRYQGKYYANHISDEDSPEDKATHFLNWIACKGC